ncbi:MAG: hypothetical protein JST80_02615 [Bdellovibrionales bacterium]|nr:hypothetical protein [Bdellovibrionales bacterium]
MSKILIVLLLVPFLAHAQGPCPDGIGSTKGDDAKYSTKAPSKWTLIVCGNKENKFNRDVYSEFEVHAINSSNKVTKLPFQAAAAENYSVAKSRSGIVFSELALIDNYWLPLFKRSISCGPAGCHVSKRYCANQKLQHKPKSAHGLIEYYRKEAAKKSSTGQATDPAELDIVFAAALGGEKEAFDAFQTNPGFRLDGASAARYDEIKKTLKQLKTSHCKYSTE